MASPALSWWTGALSTLHRVDPCRAPPTPGPGIAGVGVTFGPSWPCRALDFAGLIGIGGYRFIDRVVACYDLPLGDGFGAKLEWLTRVLTLTWLIDAAALRRRRHPQAPVLGGPCL
ncbi:MAG TPA: hypothetical protein VGV16_11805 [Gammaproteobacteria bacterium]|nr:hypothetical protein [Gammaproteobacteria bacterium]